MTVESNKQKRQISPLHLYLDAGVYHAACQVVGDGVLVVRDVGYPVVAADVVEAEDVEAIDTEPDVAQELAAAKMTVLVVDETIVHADVETAVGWGAEDVSLQSCMGRAEGQSASKACLEAQLPACGAREVVGEEEVDVVALVGGLRDGLSVQVHRGFHHAEAYPGVGAWDELAIELEVGANDVACCTVVAVIDDFQVVDVVGVEFPLSLVVGFGGELEGALGYLELVLHASHDLEGALRLDVAVELDGGVARYGDGVAQLLVEGALVVEAKGEAEGEVVVGRRHEAYAGAGTEEPFLVPAPVAEAQTVVEAEDACSRFLTVGVLGIEFEVVGIDGVLGAHVVDDLQVVARVWHAVAAAVAILPFVRVLAHLLVLPSETGLHLVTTLSQVVGELHGLHRGVEVVAGVLHVGTDAELLVAVRLVEPVLALDIVGLLLAVVEGGCGKADGTRFPKSACCPNGAEEGAELVFLLTVEIDFEGLHILQRAEVRLAVGRGEVVVVAVDIDDGVEGPVLRGCPSHIGLIVEEVGLVLALCLKAAQQVLVRLVAEAVAEGELFVAVAHIDACSEQACCDGGFQALGVAVGDVEHAGHLVAVLGLEAACREVDFLHHIAVDDGESFLLTAADEHGTIYLYTVDIDAVLVERTAADVILAGELVVGADARLGGDKLLDGIAARAGHTLQVLLVELLHRTHLSACLGNGHFSHFLAALAHHDVECQVALGLLQDALSCLVAYHAIDDNDAVRRLKRELVLAVERGGRTERLAFDADLTQRNRVLTLVNNLALQVHLGRVRLLLLFLCRCVHDAPKERQKKQYETSHHIYNNVKRGKLLYLIEN